MSNVFILKVAVALKLCYKLFDVKPIVRGELRASCVFGRVSVKAYVG